MMAGLWVKARSSGKPVAAICSNRQVKHTDVSATEHGGTQPLLAMLDNMQPFLSLAELLDELRQPVVRDLAWTLISPPLLADAVDSAAGAVEVWVSAATHWSRCSPSGSAAQSSAELGSAA